MATTTPTRACIGQVWSASLRRGGARSAICLVHVLVGLKRPRGVNSLACRASAVGDRGLLQVPYRRVVWVGPQKLRSDGTQRLGRLFGQSHSGRSEA